MYDSTIELLKTQVVANNIGDPIESTVAVHTVFCNVASSDAKEKQLAESRGKTASLTFILPDVDMYDDERWLTYKSKRYEVIDVKFGYTSNEIRLVASLWQNQ